MKRLAMLLLLLPGVAWAQAAHGRGCGGLTQGPLLAPLKGWIEETERRLAGSG